MPKLRRDVTDCVFYLYKRNQKGERVGPLGTGSIVTRPSTSVPGLHAYGVSNYHVTNEEGASIVRLNTKDGGVRFLDYAPSDWHFIKEGHDLSVVDFGNDINGRTDQFAHLQEHSFVSRDVLKDYQIGVGDDVIMIGMFVSHHGGERNVPVARFGNIAQVANENAPVRQGAGISQPSHLADMRSRTGFSGSPVLVYRTPFSDLSGIGENLSEYKAWGTEGVYTRHDWFVGLLGVHCDQFRDPVRLFKHESGGEAVGDLIREGDVLYIQSGMTIVVPAWEITAVLDLDLLEGARQQRELDFARRGIAFPEVQSG